MTVREENNDKFIVALFSLVQAIKRESENCGKACGGLNEKELIIVYLVGQKQNIKMSEIAANIDAPIPHPPLVYEPSLVLIYIFSMLKFIFSSFSYHLKTLLYIINLV